MCVLLCRQEAQEDAEDEIEELEAELGKCDTKIAHLQEELARTEVSLQHRAVSTV
jgi:uncharacterized small protein (DUF1192 family)